MSDPQRTVLIIDDDELVRRLYSTKFKKAGVAVLEAGGGKAGLAAAQESKPDLILLDIVMPDMNGYEVLKQLRASGDWGAKVPVIILTNDKLSEDELASITTSKPSYFLAKTSSMPEDVLAKVQEILGDRSD